MYGVKTYIWFQICFGFKGMPLLLRGSVRVCGRPYSVGDLRDRF